MSFPSILPRYVNLKIWIQFPLPLQHNIQHIESQEHTNKKTRFCWNQNTSFSPTHSCRPTFPSSPHSPLKYVKILSYVYDIRFCLQSLTVNIQYFKLNYTNTYEVALKGIHWLFPLTYWTQNISAFLTEQAQGWSFGGRKKITNIFLFSRKSAVCRKFLIKEFKVYLIFKYLYGYLVWQHGKGPGFVL